MRKLKQSWRSRPRSRTRSTSRSPRSSPTATPTCAGSTARCRLVDLNAVVNRVRALARKDPSEHRLVDLNAVINDVVKLVQREIASHQSMIPKSGYRFSEKIMLQQ
jgi:hypothetical protein